MGTWRVIGSTWLHNQDARSNLVSNSTPSGNKPVGIHDTMGMKFASKFIGALVIKSQLLKLVEGMLSVTGPTSTQKDYLHAAAVPPPTAVQALCLHST
eukprot:259776-Pelagomonas_calceolata.AAC.1